MRKLLALILALAMVCALAACGEKSSTSLDARPDPTAPSLDSKPRNTEPDTEPTETTAPIEDTKPADTSAATEDTTPANYGDTLHIQETVFYDQDNIRVTVQEQDLSANFNAYTDAAIQLTIENNSDMTIDFTLYDDIVFIDNYQVSAWLFETVEAGASVTGELELDCDELHLLGVTAPKTFTTKYLAFDDESYEHVSEGTASFTSDAPKPGPAVLSSDIIVFSDSDITVAEFGLYETYGDNCTYYVEIENKTGRQISVDLNNLKVNGQDLTIYDFCTVEKDCITVYGIDIYGSDLEDLGLDFDSITSMEFEISFYEDFFDADPITEASIKLSFE